MSNVKSSDKFTEVQKQAIHVETIVKEQRHLKLYEDYSINPFKKQEYLAGKPNSVQDAEELIKGKEDQHFLQVIARANLEPTKKYNYPQTEAQEVGWISTPLIHHEWDDKRINHYRQCSPITKFMDEFWKQKHNARGVGLGSK